MIKREIIQLCNEKKKKYQTVGTVPKANRKIVETSQIDTLNTQIHDHSLSWLDTDRNLCIMYVLFYCSISVPNLPSIV